MIVEMYQTMHLNSAKGAQWEWHWRIKGDNGEPMASGEGYADKRDAINCLEFVTSKEFDGEYLRGFDSTGNPDAFYVEIPAAETLTAEEFLTEASQSGGLVIGYTTEEQDQA